jgi:hypothetical protein
LNRCDDSNVPLHDVSEGIKEKDRAHLMSTLASVATVRDNTYHLMRHVWNDVQEDWPFFTEQDRQMLKRRKPQNLTPPGSSDGGSSVGSGQSPSSVHPGSPPSAIETPPSLKRPGYYNGADGLPTKRQRIAHNRKPDEVLTLVNVSLTTFVFYFKIATGLFYDYSFGDYSVMAFTSVEIQSFFLHQFAVTSHKFVKVYPLSEGLNF